jgi:hypothetical protein
MTSSPERRLSLSSSSAKVIARRALRISGGTRARWER